MRREEDTVVQFLIGLGVFSEDDVKTVQEAQVEPIVRAMTERNALKPSDVNAAKELISELMSSSNHTRRLKAQMSLMKLVTGKMHQRMSVGADRARRNKERVTSGNYPSVGRAAALAEASGD